MASAPTARTEALEAAVRRARRAAEEAGELDRPKGPFESPWPRELRVAVALSVEDGTFAAAARAVADAEPELA